MISQSVSKRDLWRYVNRKIGRLVHRYHVFAVISILFEEMVKDLCQDKPVKIANLGIITLQSTKPRWYHHVTLRKMVLSPGYRVMRFLLAKPIHKKIVSSLDLDRTLKNE
jgi:nucleoid DNA-binding protein